MGFQSLCSLQRYLHPLQSSREGSFPQVLTVLNKKSTCLLLVEKKKIPSQFPQTRRELLWSSPTERWCGSKQCHIAYPPPGSIPLICEKKNMVNFFFSNQKLVKDNYLEKHQNAIPSLNKTFQASNICSPKTTEVAGSSKIESALRGWGIEPQNSAHLCGTESHRCYKLLAQFPAPCSHCFCMLPWATLKLLSFTWGLARCDNQPAEPLSC